MKLEPNMYIRTTDGEIYIIHELVQNKNREICSTLTYKNPLKKTGKCTLVNIEYIIKNSHSIIDLIEVGDYVNGSEVCMIKPDEHDRLWIYTDSNYKVGILESEIKTVLTHEQFEREAFKV